MLVFKKRKLKRIFPIFCLILLIIGSGFVFAEITINQEDYPVYHLAKDINTKLAENRYSLQDIIDGKLGASNIWNESGHETSHLANDIKLKLGNEYYSLQDIITYNLLTGSSSQTGSSFKTSNANNGDYTKQCTEDDKSVLYNKEIVTSINLESGKKYNFTCGYNSDPKVSKEITLSSNYELIASGDEKHVSRLGVLGNEFYRGTDNYEWYVAIKDGKLSLIVKNSDAGKCPIYTVKKGLLRQETIYSFKGVECQIQEINVSSNVGINNPSNVNLQDLVWNDDDYFKFHTANEVIVNYHEEARNLQDLVDNNLIRFPYFDGTLIDFTLPTGSPEWYSLSCPHGSSGFLFNLNRKEQYAEYKGEVTTNNPFIYGGGAYDFSCTLKGTGLNQRVTSRVQLSENYSVIANVKVDSKQDPTLRDMIATGNKPVKLGSDEFAYFVALEGDKLKFRITRPSECRDSRRGSINIPMQNCHSEAGSMQGLGYCTRTQLPDGRPAPGGCGTDGFDCNGPSCLCHIGNDGCHASWQESRVSGSVPENPPEPSSTRVCVDATPIHIPLNWRECLNNACPAYTQETGLFGFKQKTVYNWPEINCGVRSVY